MVCSLNVKLSFGTRTGFACGLLLAACALMLVAWGLKLSIASTG